MLLSRTRPVSNSTTAPAASIAIANPPSSNPADPEPPTDDSDSDPESLLSAFLPHIFPDEAPPCLGNPGERLAYTSREHGDVVVVLPDYATEENSKEDGDNNTGRKFGGGDGEEDTAGNVADGVRKARGKGKDIETSRQLFAHYLWGGALAVADAIERAADADGEDEESCLWRVRGESVIELGAGAALPSIMALLVGAASVVVTDHPASAALGRSAEKEGHGGEAGPGGSKSDSPVAVNRMNRINGTNNMPGLDYLDSPIATSIRFNGQGASLASGRISIRECEWGVLPPPVGAINGEGGGARNKNGNNAIDKHHAQAGLGESQPKCQTQAQPQAQTRQQQQKLSFAITHHAQFTRVIAADCLWIPGVHTALAQTIAWFLAPSPGNITKNCQGSCDYSGLAYVVAGFHTGRAVVASFFGTAAPAAGLEVVQIEERDLAWTGEESAQLGGEQVEGELRDEGKGKREETRSTMRKRQWQPERPDEGVENRARWVVVAVLRRVR